MTNPVIETLLGVGRQVTVTLLLRDSADISGVIAAVSVNAAGEPLFIVLDPIPGYEFQGRCGYFTRALASVRPYVAHPALG